LTPPSANLRGRCERVRLSSADATRHRCGYAAATS